MRLALLFFCLGISGCCTFSARGYRGPPSDHFDGQRFFNPTSAPLDTSLSPFLKWLFTRERTPWPEHVPVTPGPKPPRRVGAGQLRVTFVGHATTLIQMDGLNILTDPVWSDAIGPDGFAVFGRIRAPGIRFEDLPPIDLVLISHSHYDHLDLPTLRRLMAIHQPRIAAGLGMAEYLRSEGVRNARDFDWWQDHPVSRTVHLRAVPTRHFSNRGWCDRETVLWTGFVLEGPAGRVYVSGDTGYGPHFEEVGRALGPFRLAVLPIGAYRPEWFMSSVHTSPPDALAAALDLRAQTAVGYHFGTFRLSDEGIDDPELDLRAAMDAAGVPHERFWVMAFGEGRSVPPVAF